MASLNFKEKRIEETYMIYKRFFGDRKKYAFYKDLQERRKRMKQKQIAHTEVAHQIAMHNQRFPFWHCVQDASDWYVSDRLKTAMPCSSISKLQRRVFDVPMLRTSMCDVLEEILSSSIEFDYLTVSCVYDHTTVDVDRKIVV